MSNTVPDCECLLQRRGALMNKQELLRRLERMIDEMHADRTFGQIAIAFRDGIPDFIRKETTEKLGAQGNTHAKTSYR
jgi:hypothetical protein